MSPARWTIEQDMSVVAFLDAVGAERIAADLKRTTPSVLRRASTLKATCAWHELEKLMRADWEHRRNYHLALGQGRALENLDMVHPSTPDELGEEHGYVVTGEAA